MARRKGWQWPVLLGGLMAVVLGANFVLVYLATSDPSFAVEENYYQKALDWDDKRAQDRANAELGWRLEFQVAPTRRTDGMVTIEARLLDREGHEIADAGIGLDAFHNARAAHVLRTDFRRGEDGGYRAALPLRRPGLWEFRFDVSRGSEHFTQSTVRELAWR